MAVQVSVKQITPKLMAYRGVETITNVKGTFSRKVDGEVGTLKVKDFDFDSMSRFASECAKVDIKANDFVKI